MNKLEAALNYVAWGWPVLPVVKNGKNPAIAGGVHSATLDPEQIRAWWERNPDLNIGIAAGAKSGIVVFDIDPRNGGDQGFEEWVAENGGECLKDAQMQETGGGGQHYIAYYDERIKSSKLAQGVDLISDGRYFIAAPSIVNGGFYDWECSSDPFDGVAPFVVPDQWFEAMGQSKIKTPLQEVKDGGQISDGGRHSALVAMAGAMRNCGLSEAEMFAAVQVANEARCEFPLSESEIKGICERVSKYSSDNDDQFESIALGNLAAENLLAGIKQDKDKFYWSHGGSLISQPSPVPWAVRGWVPKGSSTMIFGPSGIGKSFVAVDMACSIVTGTDWCGVKMKKKGVVAYMAGEGNWGMRSRLASWCKKHNEYDIDNLLVSNMPIDLDQDGVDAQIIASLGHMTDQDLDVIFIDTLNRHMAGDENSAQDVRKLINICGSISAATGATTVLIHHTGHGDGTGKKRERGSSALRASMDVSILVSEDKGRIRVKCVKQKDAIEPEPIFVKLEQISLGWLDDEGIDQPGAVIVMNEDQEQGKDEQGFDVKLIEKRRHLENAWLSCGREYQNGLPYITRSAFLNYLIENGVFNTEKTAKNQVSPNTKSGLIKALLDAEIVLEYGAGWVVTCASTSAVLALL